MGKNMLYEKWAMEWLDEKRKYVKVSTYANYQSIIVNHLIPEIGKCKINNISNKMLQEMIFDKYLMGRIDNRGGLSDKTVRDIGMVLKLTLRDALKDGIIDYMNLTFNYPKKENKKKIYIFDKKEQKKIINYCMSNVNIKNMCILLTLYSGLRIGELCALKWKDIDFKKNILSVNKTLQRVYFKIDKCSKLIITNPKTKNANREIPINSDFAKLLKIFKTGDDNFVVSNSRKIIEPKIFRNYYYKMIKEVGINNIPFHSLRHTFASNCIRLGVDYKTVSELLGHSSVNITLNIYVHPQMAEKKKCINLIYAENNIIDTDNNDYLDDNKLFCDNEIIFVN